MTLQNREPRPVSGPGQISPIAWIIGGIVAIVALVAVAALVLNNSSTNQQSAYQQGVAQATAVDANQNAQSAANQAANAAAGANAAAASAQNQAVARTDQENGATPPPAQAAPMSNAPSGPPSSNP